MNKKLNNLIIPATLVVAGITLHLLFNPFSLLLTGRKNLRQTPVMIESIRGIGQLITAEYSGEVISTLQ